MKTLLPPDEINDIEQLRQRFIVAERDLATKIRLINKLERVIAQLAQHHWGRSSEKHIGQGDLSLFNEAKLAALQATLDDEPEDSDERTSEPAADTEDVAKAEGDDKASPSNSATPRLRRQLPDHLERVCVTRE